MNDKHAAAMKEQGYKQERWTYIGVRRGVKHPLVDSWVPSDHEVDDKEALYFKKDRARKTIGGIYAVWVKRADERLTFAGETYTGETYEDSALRAAWRAEHDAAEADARRDKTEKLAKDEELAVLAPLQRRYLRSDSTTRTLIELQVLRYLRMTKFSA